MHSHRHLHAHVHYTLFTTPTQVINRGLRRRKTAAPEGKTCWVYCFEAGFEGDQRMLSFRQEGEGHSMQRDWQQEKAWEPTVESLVPGIMKGKVSKTQSQKEGWCFGEGVNLRRNINRRFLKKRKRSRSEGRFLAKEGMVSHQGGQLSGILLYLLGDLSFLSFIHCTGLLGFSFSLKLFLWPASCDYTSEKPSQTLFNPFSAGEGKQTCARVLSGFFL